MAEDARFEDGGDQPVALRALEAEDVPVISALVQDAIFPITEMKYDRARRRFALLVNRFRWERRGQKSAPERVQSVLAIEDVQHVATQGIDRSDADMVLSLLALDWQPGEDGTGRIELTLAGDGAVALEVEALELTLKDVTQPYRAPSGRAPEHGD